MYLPNPNISFFLENGVEMTRLILCVEHPVEARLPMSVSNMFFKIFIKFSTYYKFLALTISDPA